MKTFWLAVFWVATFSPATAQLKIDEDRFIDLYNGGDYVTLFNEAIALRKEEYGKTPLVDYFIAKSLCGLGEYPSGKKCFENIIRLYSLSSTQKGFFRVEAQKCQMQADFETLGRNTYFAFNANGESNIPRARSAGKLGYVLDCKDSIAFGFDPRFDSLNYESRLFQISEGDRAVAYYAGFLGPKYNVNLSGRFILITAADKTLTSNGIRDAAASLEKAYQFYATYFNIRPPDKLITVYLMGNKEKLAEVARATHGIILPKSNVGYSVLNDLSVLGNSNERNIGTIYHELFHIMIRTDVGDIPGWLDEGVASLYATSHWQGSMLKGNIEQWRTEVLKEYLKTKSSLPTLDRLIANNWSEFSSSESSACDIAVNYALAHHLAIYFQEHNLLQAVVEGFKNRPNVLANGTDSTWTDHQVLREVLGYDLATLETKFGRWMNATYDFKSHSNGLAKYWDEEANMMAQQIFDDAAKALALHNKLQTLVQQQPALSSAPTIAKLMRDYRELHDKYPDLFNPVSQSAVYLSPNDRSFARKLQRFAEDANKFLESHP